MRFVWCQRYIWYEMTFVFGLCIICIQDHRQLSINLTVRIPKSSLGELDRHLEYRDLTFEFIFEKSIFEYTMHWMLLKILTFRKWPHRSDPNTSGKTNINQTAFHLIQELWIYKKIVQKILYQSRAVYKFIPALSLQCK